MFRQTSCLAASLCASRFTFHAPFAASFNLEAAKARTMVWEPAFKFDDLTPKPHEEKQEGKEDGMSWMTTYSAFNPGFIRPVLLESRPPIVLPSLPLLPSLEEKVGESLERKEEGNDMKTDHKPWPYHLPKFLQPEDGTTFSVMDGAPTTTTLQSKHAGILKAVLYGVREPNTFSYAREVVALGCLLNKVLYGVRKMDDGDEKITTANITVPKKGERKVKEVRRVVRNQEVKVEEVLEKDDADGMVAK